MAASISKLQQALEATKKRAANIKEKSDEVGKQIVGAAVTAGSAGALGMLDGYDEEGGLEIAGFPATLAAGIGGHVVGAMTGNRTFHDVGNGGLAAFAYTWGRGAGQEFREKRENEDKGGDPTVQGTRERYVGGGRARRTV